MYEGIILKVTADYSIAKSKNEFVRIHTKPGMEIGQKIYYSQKDLVTTIRKKKTPATYLLRYGVAAALALLLLTSPLMNTKSAYAAKLLVEVNPSVLLKLSDEGLVKEALAYNDEATALPLDSYLKLPLAEAVEKIVQDAEANGYLNLTDEEEDYVILTEILDEKDPISEELYGILQEKALESEVLKEMNVVFATASEDLFHEHENQGKALGLERLREEFNLGPDETLGDFFKDPVRREAYKAEKRLLQRDTLEEDEDLVTELDEEAMAAFKEQLAVFKASIDEVKAARKAYQAARKAGDPVAIEDALAKLRAAELKKAEMEALKDELESYKDQIEEAPEVPVVPETPETPVSEKPEKPETPVKPVNPGNSGEKPVNPSTPGNQGNSKTPGNSGNSSNNGTPGNSGSNGKGIPKTPGNGKSLETPVSENNN